MASVPESPRRDRLSASWARSPQARSSAESSRRGRGQRKTRPDVRPEARLRIAPVMAHTELQARGQHRIASEAEGLRALERKPQPRD